ncbi:DUF2989 domain-containing protein [Oceanisphaera sp. W20_SRM_FM3]|uniref:DUF2989 domain-containing protein n=1 Tax=Oceanisphaera sp. W20_SRM_FM3 TaxID=3240267 RepID=UPI003F9ABD66
MKKKQMFLLLATPLFLAACDRDRIPNICEGTPQFCVDLHSDGWCKFERTALIRARKQQATLISDANDYDLLLKVSAYHDCLDPLLAIEYTRRKERKTDKVDAVYHAKETMNQLAADTKDSDYPPLLLWHWQHEGSQQAKARFIKLADRPEMQVPDLQNSLAELLMLRDHARAAHALHTALSLYNKSDVINSDIIANLLTLAVRQKRYQDAWVWTRVLSNLDYEQNIDEGRMETYARFSDGEQQQMQQRVEDILEQLKQGTYRAPSPI